MRSQLLIILTLLLFTGCNSWLDVTPKTNRPQDEYWKTKEDVLNTLGATYARLRNCQESLLNWGELRSDMLDVGPGLSTDALDVRDFEITVTNDVAKWSTFYKVINNANTIIERAPKMLEQDIDPTFTVETCNAYIAEALSLRALCYFYLVRSFRDVPYITLPYLSDENSYANKKEDGNTILDSVIVDLEWAAIQLAAQENEDGALSEETSRMNRWAVYCLLADIHLWRGNYQECIEWCSRIEKSNKYGLAGNESWYTNFYPGRNVEIIFSLFYDHDEQQTNSLFTWFDNTNNARYYTSSFAINLFNEDYRDVRGESVSYIKDGSIYKAWKYLGVEGELGSASHVKRPLEERSPNWIFYRFADVVLMKAEASILKGDTETAVNELNKIKKRAMVSQLDHAEFQVLTIERQIEELLKERRKEFFSEGKIWFDVIRVGLRDEYKYYDLMIEEILKNVSVSDRPIWKTKLMDPYSLFLPIHYDEISSSNGLLEQNPYYKL